MKNTLLPLLLVMVLILSACAGPVNAPQDTTPTPPTIQTTKTPLELLTEAVSNTQNAGACTVQYGIVTTAGEDQQKTLYTQALSPEHPLNWDTLYTQVPDFPTNEHLLPDLCSKSLQAIPSNTGVIRYQVTDLTDAEMSALLYGQAGDNQNITGTVAIEADASNRFTRLELIWELDAQNTVTIFLSMQFSE